MRGTLLRCSVIGVALGIVRCGGSSNDAARFVGGSNGIGPSRGSDAIHTGGAPGSTLAAGGNSARATGGTAASNGGASGTASPITGGVKASGGTNSTNADTAAGGYGVGGKSATGGTAAGGTLAGSYSANGSTIKGGATNGKSATGGAAAGSSGSGGANSATGGTATGGKSTTGGAHTGGANSTSTGTTDPCSATNTLSDGTPHCNQNTSGSYGNYEWQLWSNQSKGCLTTYSGAGAAFSANWDDAGDLLARAGLVFDGTKTHQELGTISAEFSETRAGNAGNFSYIGVYGIAISPTFEFYIVEDSFSALPVKPSGTSKLMSFQVDGGTYDVYSATASGTTMTTELYSIRQTSRQCGHISVSEHFSQWATAGKVLGKLEEVRLFVEAGGGSGSIDFTTADVVVR